MPPPPVPSPRRDDHPGRSGAPLNLVSRLASGSALLAVVAAALWLGGVPIDIVLGVFAAGGLWEYRGLTSRMGLPPLDALLFPAGLALLYREVFTSAAAVMLWVAAGALAALMVVELVQGGRARLGWVAAVAGALWIGYLLGFYLGLLHWRSGDEHYGLRLVVLALGGAVIGDSAAYFGGSALGRHRLAARISPKKSVEGALFGLAGTTAWTVGAGAWLVGLAPVAAVVLGLVAGVAEQGGDLFESALKRRAGVKDSSRLIPGHGGVLDRLDSLLPAGAVVYLVLKLFGQA